MEHLDVEGLKEGPTGGYGPKSWSRRTWSSHTSHRKKISALVMSGEGDRL